MSETHGVFLVTPAMLEAAFDAFPIDMDDDSAPDPAYNAIYNAMRAAETPLAIGTDFVAGMEAAAQLCDEEAQSAKSLLAEGVGCVSQARVEAIRDGAEALAKTIRVFAADQEWVREASTPHNACLAQEKP
jgi:hypothetical protein